MRLLFVYILCVLAIFFVGCQSTITVVEERSEEASIFPDYQGELLIPNNIAPLNFEIQESGNCFAVQIVSNATVLLEKHKKSPQIMFSEKAWKNILQNHIGDTLEIRVFSGDSYDKMIAYKPFRWIVSEDSIDSYVVYRHIAPVEPPINPQPIGIYERNLENFDVRTLIDSYLSDNSCMNCHHFSANQSSKMCIHFRRQHSGTLITTADSAFMVNLELPNGAKGIFGAYSPNERFLTFSTNQMGTEFTIKAHRLRMWSYEIASNIIVYDVLNNAIFSSDELMSSGYQKTYPCWSHDGKYLYFCRSNWQPSVLTDSTSIFERIRNTYFDLARVAMRTDDTPTTPTFDTTEILVASKDMNLRSVSFPASSPDGRFISFSTTDFGTLDPNSIDGRLGLYNLTTNMHEELEPDNNAPIVSSSSWSSNSRWLVVCSRRIDGIFSRPFLAHVDTLGNVSKLFVIPQENPSTYRKQDYSYSLPELISHPVPMSAYDISDAIRKPVKQPIYSYGFDTLLIANPSGESHFSD